MNKILLIVLLKVLSLPAMAEDKADKKDLVIATINGTKISKAEFDEAYKQNMLFVSNHKVTKEKVLTDLTNRILGIDKALASNLQNDPIVKAKMNDILYHAQISKDLEPRLKKIIVTDKEVKEYYQDHQEFRIAHILLRMRAEPSVEEETAAKEQIAKIYKQAKDGTSKFPELARKFSQSSTSANGGDMGFQPAIRLAPEFLEAIRNEKKGHITPPVKTQYGYHVIKILDVKDYKDINKELYKKIIYDEKRDQILAGYFSELRKKADIKVNKKLLNE